MSIATFLTSGMIPLPFNRSTLEGFYALGIDIGKVKFAKIRAKRHHDLEGKIIEHIFVGINVMHAIVYIFPPFYVVSVHRISEVHGISLTKTQIMAVSNRLRNFNNIMIVSKSTRPAPVPKPSKPAKKKKLPPTSKDSAGAGSAPKRKRIEV